MSSSSLLDTASEGATYLIGAVSSNVTARVEATFWVTSPGTVSVTTDAGNTDSVRGEKSSRVTKVPLAESRRLFVTESKSSEYIEREDRKRKVKSRKR